MRRGLDFIALCNASVCDVTSRPDHIHSQRIAVMGREMSTEMPAASIMSYFQHNPGVFTYLLAPVTFVNAPWKV